MTTSEPQWMTEGKKPPRYGDIKQIMTEFQNGHIDEIKMCRDLDQIEANNEEVEYVESEIG